MTALFLTSPAAFFSSNVKKVYLPESLMILGESAFRNCSKLDTINIPKGIKSLPAWIFCDCHELKSITLPDTLESIGDNAFLSTSLDDIIFPKSLKEIGFQSFMDTHLSSVVLPDGLEVIGRVAFTNIDELIYVEIPSTVKEIGEHAFWGTQLAAIVFNGAVPKGFENSICYDGIVLHPATENKKLIVCYPAAEDSWVNYVKQNTLGCTDIEWRAYECDNHHYNVESFSEKGYTNHKCSSCNDEFNETITHKFGEWIVTTKPTCTLNGVEIRKCKNCDKTETRYLDALGHDFSEWSVTTEPKCTEKGEETGTCSVCGTTGTREVDALGHDYVETVVAPTCTTKGYTHHKCSRCGDEYNDAETDIVAHTYSDWDIKSYDRNTGENRLERKCIYCMHTESKMDPTAVQRYAGSGRFATAAQISLASFKTAKTVVLAYGLNSADALAGVPLAVKYNAPILLTNAKVLPNETLAEIKRLKATNVIILGGEGAIGKDVEKLLKNEGLTTQRVAGKTRFGTATAIAEQLTKNPEEIFFVYAFNFADALSASTVAAVKGAPIIYLKTNGDIDADTAAYLAKVKGKVKKAYVIGGTGVISDDMMNKAKNALGLDTITRVAGANRYATCIEVNNTFKDYLTGNGICVAKGLDFPDALAGGVFAALKKMPLFLADGSLKDVQTNYLGNKDISNVYVFGGTGAVPDDLVEKIAKAS